VVHVALSQEQKDEAINLIDVVRKLLVGMTHQTAFMSLSYVLCQIGQEAGLDRATFMCLLELYWSFNIDNEDPDLISRITS